MCVDPDFPVSYLLGRVHPETDSETSRNMQFGGQRELPSQLLRGGFGSWFQAAAVGCRHPGPRVSIAKGGRVHPFFCLSAPVSRLQLRQSHKTRQLRCAAGGMSDGDSVAGYFDELLQSILAFEGQVFLVM